MPNFSRIELRDLAKAWIAISIAFGIVISGGIFSEDFFATVLLAFLTVGVGFIVHELAHKLVAQRYRFQAEFRSDDKMLILAIFMSFLGFVFAAPGAVMIRGHMDMRKYGHISLAGPAMNIVLALLFLSVIPVLTGAAQLVASYGIMINGWLALFNMLPFGNFDGIKILRWSKPAYFSTVAIAAVIVFLI